MNHSSKCTRCGDTIPLVLGKTIFPLQNGDGRVAGLQVNCTQCMNVDTLPTDHSWVPTPTRQRQVLDCRGRTVAVMEFKAGKTGVTSKLIDGSL